MIFSPELAAKVMDGSKVVTRRPVKLVPNLQPDGWDGQRDGMSAMPCRYEVGKDYAVQPGRGKKQIGRIKILLIDQQPLYLALTHSEARREGFSTPATFEGYWTALYGFFDPQLPVWRIEFSVGPRKIGAA